MLVFMSGSQHGAGKARSYRDRAKYEESGSSRQAKGGPGGADGCVTLVCLPSVPQNLTAKQIVKNQVIALVVKAPVVQQLDSAIHWISLCAVGNQLPYPLDGDLSGGQRYPVTFGTTWPRKSLIIVQDSRDEKQKELHQRTYLSTDKQVFCQTGTPGRHSSKEGKKNSTSRKRPGN